MTTHRHRAYDFDVYPWRCATPLACTPAAHGNVTLVDLCRCGATRKTTVNGKHEERGEWIEADA